MKKQEDDTKAIKVLYECIDLMKKKSLDYQNPNSTVKQADYYPSGIMTIYEIMHAKMLRTKSLLEAAKFGSEPNNESIEDSLKDLINYASFAAAWMENGIEGQCPERDMFNESLYE